MRHRHSRIALIESRLFSPQSAQALAQQLQASLPSLEPSQHFAGTEPAQRAVQQEHKRASVEQIAKVMAEIRAAYRL